jgi:hypothetical protein
LERGRRSREVLVFCKCATAHISTAHVADPSDLIIKYTFTLFKRKCYSLSELIDINEE